MRPPLFVLLALAGAGCRAPDPAGDTGKVDSQDTATSDSRETADSTPAVDSDSGAPGDSQADSDSPADTSTDSGSSGGVSFELDAVARAKLLGEDSPSSGHSAALSAVGDLDGDGQPDVAVGMWTADRAGEYAGAAYVVPGSVEGAFDLGAAPTIVDGAAGECAGSPVAGVGDVDGDGFDDLLVGAGGYSSGLGDGWEGRAYLLAGPIRGETSTAAAVGVFQGSYWPEATGAEPVGGHAAAAGDTDGDGLADLLIGAIAGAHAYLILGPATGFYTLDDDADMRFTTDATNLCGPVTSAGDVDGDGLDDILIGNPANPDARVLLFDGPVSGELGVADADAAFADADPDDAVGYHVAGPGDTNGDGYSDVLVGSPGDDDAADAAGAVYVVEGPTTGTTDLPTGAAKLEGGAPLETFGASVGASGDLNGDGFADLIAGSPLYGGSDYFADGPGRAWVAFGPFDGVELISDVGVALVGDGDDCASYDLGSGGAAVAGAGDIDGDGFDDILVAGPGDDDGGVNAGAAWLVSGASLVPDR